MYNIKYVSYHISNHISFPTGYQISYFIRYNISYMISTYIYPVCCHTSTEAMAHEKKLALGKSSMARASKTKPRLSGGPNVQMAACDVSP